MKVVITGGSGFIGSTFVDFMLKKYPTLEIINLDNLSYAALQGSNDFAESTGRYKHIYLDIVNANEVVDVFCRYMPTHIVHLAAESSVDASLSHVTRHRFMETNVLGTNNIFDAARICNTEPNILNMVTDEIFGSVLQGSSDEDYPWYSRNPYAASKAAAECIANSYIESFGLNIKNLRCVNNFGPRQDGSKFIPKSIFRVLSGKPILLNDKGQHVRSWIHVEQHCRAIDSVLMNGKPGLSYNVPSNEELSNLEMAKLILKTMNISESFYEFANLRQCDDLRYSISSKRIHETGYIPEEKYLLKNSFNSVVKWYIDYAKKYPTVLM